jgi:diguanylate cyclase (GGDEF)-like protein
MPLLLPSDRAEATLATLAQALDVVDVGIVLLNRDLHVLYANQRFLDMWTGSLEMLAGGATLHSVLDKFAASLPYPIAAPELSAYLDRREAAVRAGSVAPLQIDLRDGRRVLFRCVPCADGGRILTWIDITLMKRVQELRQEEHDAAERMMANQRFTTETMEDQAAYLATLAESADENARRAEEARQQLEHEIAERRLLEEQLRHMATTDGLTGTLNRARLMALGQHELLRARENSRGLGVLMLDIDHFKQINDRYGHQAGDAALQHFVAQLRAGVREIDLLGRLGGEEFAIVLPGIPAEAALQVAERLRARVAGTPLAYLGQTISITVSIGLAMTRDDDQTLEQILGRADGGLYAAKDAGRDRVVWADVREPHGRAVG